MSKILTLLDHLGEKTTRTDLWTLCLIGSLIWGLWQSQEIIILTILGYMSADLIGKEVADVYKVKHYAESIKQNNGDSPTTDSLDRSGSLASSPIKPN